MTWQYAILILEQLMGTDDSKLIHLACTPSDDDKRAAYPPFSAPKLLLQNAHKFPGMTLTVSADPKTQIMETSEALVKEMPSLKKLGKEIEAAWEQSGSLRAMRMVLQVKDEAAMAEMDEIDMMSMMMGGGMGGRGGGVKPKKKKKSKKKPKDEV